MIGMIRVMLGSATDSATPDYVEPFVGWRYWKLRDGQITSPDRGTAWPQGQLSWDGMCHCGAEPREGRTLPGSMLDSFRRRLFRRQCHCGINSWATKELALTSEVRAYRRQPAIGEVALWGRINAYETGYRAEHARIMRLWATSEEDAELVETAASREGIPYAGVLTPTPPRLRFLQPRAWLYLLAALAALIAFDQVSSGHSSSAAFAVGAGQMLVAGALTLRAIKQLYWTIALPGFYGLLVLAGLIEHFTPLSG